MADYPLHLTAFAGDVGHSQFEGRFSKSALWLAPNELRAFETLRPSKDEQTAGMLFLQCDVSLKAQSARSRAQQKREALNDRQLI